MVQSDRFNASRLGTVIVVVLTTNARLAAMPGNVALPAAVTGLPHDSVANVTQVITLDRDELTDLVGTVPAPLLDQVDRGLALVLGP